MANEFNLSVTMMSVVCADCGMVFGLPAGFVSERQKDERTFYCPNGHARCWLNPESKRLREEIAGKERERRVALAETRRLKAVEKQQEKQRHLAEKLAVRQDSTPPRERWLEAANGPPPGPAAPTPPAGPAVP